jgi:hypothetical protein
MHFNPIEVWVLIFQAIKNIFFPSEEFRRVQAANLAELERIRKHFDAMADQIRESTDRTRGLIKQMQKFKFGPPPQAEPVCAHASVEEALRLR